MVIEMEMEMVIEIQMEMEIFLNFFYSFLSKRTKKK